MHIVLLIIAVVALGVHCVWQKRNWGDRIEQFTQQARAENNRLFTGHLGKQNTEYLDNRTDVERYRKAAMEPLFGTPSTSQHIPQYSPPARSNNVQGNETASRFAPNFEVPIPRVAPERETVLNAMQSSYQQQSVENMRQGRAAQQDGIQARIAENNSANRVRPTN